jgi:DNA replication protein DnaC/ActR/RegA family two-component response regulator
MASRAEHTIEGLIRSVDDSKRLPWHNVAAKAVESRWSFGEFITALKGDDTADAREGLAQRVAASGIPAIRSLDDFDFGRTGTLHPAALKEYVSPTYWDGGPNLMLTGHHGSGKTHLAIAIAYEAMRQGVEARYVRLAEVAAAVFSAEDRSAIVEILRDITKTAVVVVDDVGTDQLTRPTARLLYQIVSERRRNRVPTILNTDRTPAAWSAQIGDRELIRRIVDAVLGGGHLISLGGVMPPSRTQIMAAVGREGIDVESSGRSRHSLEIVLDVLGGDARQRDAAIGRTPVPTEGPVRVLVAQDDEVSQELLEHYFALMHWEVIFTADGNEAYNLLLRQPFHVAVLDVNLPHRSGFELLKLAQRHSALEETQVILLTAHGLEATELKAFEMGAADFASRPFSPPVLVARIKRLLEPDSSGDSEGKTA